MFEGINGALQVAVIDMILVFAVLGGLALVMVFLKNSIGIKGTEKTAKKTMIAPPTINTVKTKEKEEVDSELIAVITAAVASYSEKQRSEFKVVSIRKYKSSIVAPWTIMGRQELMLREK